MRCWWLSAMVLCACHSAPVREPVTESDRPTSPAPEKKQRIVVTETSVEALDPIVFLSGSPTLDPRSYRLLENVANTLIGNPSIELVAVHAYADDALPQFQLPLASERASRMVKFLVDHGVEPSRLVTRGEANAPAGSRAFAAFEILRRTP